MKKLVVVLSLMLGYMGLAHAGEVAVYGGGAFSNTTLIDSAGQDNHSDSAGTLGGQVLFSVNDILSLGIDLSHSGLGGETTAISGYPSGTVAQSQASTTVGLIMAKLSTSKESTTFGIFKPYVAGGLGFHQSKLSMDATLPAGYSWLSNRQRTESLVDDTKTGIAIAGAIGVEVPLNNVLFVGTEARLTYLGQTTFTAVDGTAIQASGTVINLLVKAGLKF
jgi:opacity protein-like surface antigen